MKALVRLLPLTAAACALLLASSCGRSQFLLVSVVPASGLPAATTFTALSVTLTNEGLDSSQEITAATPTFTLPVNFSAELPGNLSGTVALTVAGLDGFDVLARGSASVLLTDADVTSVTVFLAPEAVCGDGTTEGTEECDDGNTVDGDGCSSLCGIEPLTCGDGLCDMAAGETCTNCVTDCMSDPACAPATCGDGVLDAGEECDDGNNTSGDGCSATCTNEGGPGCGNSVVDAGEECDDGNADDTDDCPSTCMNATCGDGFLWAGMEECDDLDPMDNSDGCLPGCVQAGPLPAVAVIDDVGNLVVHGANDAEHLGLGTDQRAAVTGGDINGDGIDDLIMGAPEADGPGGTRSEAGAIYVVFGRDFPETGNVHDAAGAFGMPVDLTIHGAAPAHLLGRSVVVAEVTGDAIADLIISATNADPGGRPNAGMVWIIEGSNALPATIDLATMSAYAVVWGANSDDQAGSSLAVGNVTGTGGAVDVIIGTPFADGPSNGRPEAGEVVVLAGPVTPGVHDLAIPGAWALRVDGADPGDNLGWSVAAGNVDGDVAGYDDLLMTAARGDGPGNGRVDAGEGLLYLGSAGLSGTRDASTPAGAPDVWFYGAADFDLMESVAVGDVNADGLADILLGASYGDDAVSGTFDVGRAVLYLGRSFMPGQVFDLGMPTHELEILGTLSPLYGGSQLGRTVAIFDADASGTVDVVTGASIYHGTALNSISAVAGVVDPPVSMGSSLAYGLPGSGISNDTDFIFYGPPNVIAYGLHGAAGVGDINNDGFPDFALAGSFLPSGPGGARPEGGRIHVFFSGPGPLTLPGACFDGVDNDGDGDIDQMDSGCTSLSDPDELLGTQCDDGVDNDGDGITDIPAEPGCENVFDDDETDPSPLPECSDSVDNDGDGTIDWPADLSCVTAGQDNESCLIWGNDAFGYEGCVEYGQPVATMPCENLIGDPAATPACNGDDCSTPVSFPGGFVFDFYGLGRSTMTVISNGKIGFPGTTSYSNMCTIESDTIAPYWDDLLPPMGGSVRYRYFNAPVPHMTVQWNVPHISGGMLYDIRAVLWNGGDMDFCYVDTTTANPSTDEGLSATIGLGGPGGEQLLYSCDAPDAPDGTVIHITHP